MRDVPGGDSCNGSTARCVASPPLVASIVASPERATTTTRLAPRSAAPGSATKSSRSSATVKHVKRRGVVELVCCLRANISQTPVSGSCVRCDYVNKQTYAVFIFYIPASTYGERRHARRAVSSLKETHTVPFDLHRPHRVPSCLPSDQGGGKQDFFSRFFSSCLCTVLCLVEKKKKKKLKTNGNRVKDTQSRARDMSSSMAHPEHVRTVCLVIIAGILSAAALHWLSPVMVGHGVFQVSLFPSACNVACSWPCCCFSAPARRVKLFF